MIQKIKRMFYNIKYRKQIKKIKKHDGFIY